MAWAECLLCPFDVPALFSQDTFARAKNWVKELQRQASPNIVIALAGNKADLANKRAVEFQVWGMDRTRGRSKPAAWLSPGYSGVAGRVTLGGSRGFYLLSSCDSSLG